MNRRLIIFDVDGTLVDSQEMIARAIDLAFNTCGLVPPERAATLSMVGLSLPEFMAGLAPDLPPHEIAGLVDAYRTGVVALRAERNAGAHAPLYPGARQALEKLHGQSETFLGVATGKAWRGLDHVLAIHDLRKFFVTCQTADDHPSKPHPSMIRQALLETGCSTQSAVMVGDTEFDMQMGLAAGVRSIGVDWGHHDVDRLRAAGAHRIVSSFAELLDAVQTATA